ncbi:methylated-DNA--[protein]-cysteine S-methyltransferase [Photobacterium angustum]|uniref:Methylated-DNA--protein-cysteine methyltransferase n=1 Tax=Photobacterium angustum TaxID=661 RepID=A0A855SHM1_PHOAN|nr:methylated-DNA--[protein]-cysteine S-methyltransferase [Photobacterium angustum]KJF79811.1 cysteine methyltransferase [Photobacterium damselae subsp. damselae]KJG42450.1 cysteine methyltransferase [Photobacterium angustum]KJG43302.1 cysteine methyltransferase [Photobacterium angustum]KJG49747.1 cysteine methyltransferase [Photobacterium angustum]KJG54148.1 cysteine methyltransferase [Photobacterium angustum]
MDIFFKHIDSPLGQMTITANENALLSVWFESHTIPSLHHAIFKPDHAILLQCEEQLAEYFSGNRKQFSVPLSFEGTQFQERVWQTLTTIPYGQTWHYQQLANAIDNPNACRAVGSANGKNTLSVIVPCHRVITKSGNLGGYAGGNHIKQQLLALEKQFK